MQLALPARRTIFPNWLEQLKTRLIKLWQLLGDELPDAAIPQNGIFLYAREAFPEEALSQKEQAVQALNRYSNQILRLAAGYLHNPDDAEEILQETLIRRMTNAPVFTESEHEKAWLLKVAANLCKNKLDYEKRRITEDVDAFSETLSDEGRDDLSFVWEAVGKLPPGMRAVVHLYYHEGMPTGEIARILGKNESSVRSALRKGRIKLREILKEGYDFD